MRGLIRPILAASVLCLVPAAVLAQGRAAPVEPGVAMVPLPPATRLEAFLPVPGAVVTIGFDPLRGLQSVPGVNVEVREVRDDRGNGARGLVVRVLEGEDRRDVSFVDDDEVPSLLAGIDTLLQASGNPTAFAMFEQHYATRGEFEVSVASNARGELVYAVQAGRALRAQRILTAADMTRLRGLVEAAQTRLTTARPR